MIYNTNTFVLPQVFSMVTLFPQALDFYARFFIFTSLTFRVKEYVIMNLQNVFEFFKDKVVSCPYF